MNGYFCTRSIIGGILLLIPHLIFGQTFSNSASSSKSSIRWGVVPQEDLQMERYKLDPDAIAVILGDQGLWTPENWDKGRVRLFRHVRIKILKEEGLTYAQREIRYRKGEKLGGFRAQTHTWDPNSKQSQTSKLSIKSLPPDSVEGEDIIRSFSFENVQVGSVIEYRYSLVAEAMEELKPWYFQSEIPTRWSEVQTRGFENYIHKSIPMGLEIPPTGRGLWRAKFISALPKESLSGNPMQYRSGIRFYLTEALMKDDVKLRWTQLRERLQYNTFLDPEEKQLQALYKLSLSLTRNAITEEEKAASIHKHLQEYLKWNGKYELWVQKDPASLYKSRTGNGTELNMLLFYLLDMADLKPEQVFVSTKNHGPASKFPLFDQYDHLICRVKAGETTLYLDLTEKLASYDLPSLQVLNGPSLLLKDSTTHLITLNPYYKSNSLWMVQVDLSESSLDMEVKESHSGYAALARRKQLAAKKRGILNLGDPLRPMKQAAPITPRYEHIETPEFPLDIYYEESLNFQDFCEVKGDSMFISPLVCFEASMPFKEKKRILPIDLEFLRSYNFMVNFSLPEGYKVAKMPSSIKMSVASKSLGFTIQANEISGVIAIHSKFEVLKPQIYPEDYPALREFYQKMLDRESEKIVLVKE